MGRKKSVLIMTSALSGGGVERVSETHFRLLQENGAYDLGLAVCDPALGTNIPLEKCFIFKDFRGSNVNKLLGTLGLGLNLDTMRNCLRAFMPDIIHLHAYVQFGPSAMREIMAYKRATNCKVVLSHHTYSYICPNDALFNYKTWEPCEKCFDRQYSHIVKESCYGSFWGSVGKYIQKGKYYNLFSQGLVDVHIASSNFMKEKLNAVYPTLDARIIYNPCLKRVAQTIPKKTPDKIVYFGRMSREKNVIAAVRAIGDMPYMNLVLIGNGPESERIQEEVRSKKATNITFVNRFVPQQELYGMIDDAEYFILPSVCYESSTPVAAIEALNMGMVPLVSHHGGMKEMVELMHAGYCFDPNNIVSIQETIHKAKAEHKDDMSNLLGSVREKLELFTEERHLQDMISVYQNC